MSYAVDAVTINVDGPGPGASYPSGFTIRFSDEDFQGFPIRFWGLEDRSVKMAWGHVYSLCVTRLIVFP